MQLAETPLACLNQLFKCHNTRGLASAHVLARGRLHQLETGEHQKSISLAFCLMPFRCPEAQQRGATPAPQNDTRCCRAHRHTASSATARLHLDFPQLSHTAGPVQRPQKRPCEPHTCGSGSADSGSHVHAAARP